MTILWVFMVFLLLVIQLCLSGLGDRSRMEANGAILGVSLLMEDVLNSGGRGAAPLRLHDNKAGDSRGKPEEVYLHTC